MCGANHADEMRRLSNHYQFSKPNDVRALDLMNAAAQHTVRILPDITIAYGHSDEYSFVFHKSTTLFERRRAKITSTVVSTFTAAYIHLWPSHLVSQHRDEEGKQSEPQEGNVLEIDHLPTFDARSICYPSFQNLRDYLSWRQADCHINNLYNTTFWALVLKGKMTNAEAEEFLKGTFSADKNEILFSKFGVNYNNEPEIFKKGSTVIREYKFADPATNQSEVENGLPTDIAMDETAVEKELSRTQQEKIRKARQKARVVVCHSDIIKADFWEKRPWLLTGRPGIPLTTSESAITD